MLIDVLGVHVSVVDCWSSCLHPDCHWSGDVSQNRDGSGHLHNHQHPRHPPDLSLLCNQATHHHQHCRGGQGGV